MEKPGAKTSAVLVADHEVGAVADAQLVDVANRWSAAYRANTSDRPGLDPDADEREPAVGLPLGGLGELLVAELDPDLARTARSGAGSDSLIAMSR